LFAKREMVFWGLPVRTLAVYATPLRQTAPILLVFLLKLANKGVIMLKYASIHLNSYIFYAFRK
ncbi:MAG: hypothetical protein RR731_02010, partial [Oscillospiraceae bacterium]